VLTNIFSITPRLYFNSDLGFNIMIFNFDFGYNFKKPLLSKRIWFELPNIIYLRREKQIIFSYNFNNKFHKEIIFN